MKLIQSHSYEDEALVEVYGIDEGKGSVYMVDIYPKSHSHYSGMYADKSTALDVAKAMFNNIIRNR